jgi:hypothetical protein
MKTQRTVTDYKCDECGKQVVNYIGFPYKDNWIFIYSFNYKLVNKKTERLIDKHFCCDRCLFQFLKNKFQRDKDADTIPF